MNKLRQNWRRFLGWLADWQIVPLALLTPVLLFPDRLPRWLVAVALLALPALWLLYRLARGHFFTRTPVDLPLLILLLTLPVGMWMSAQLDVTWPHIVKYLLGVGMFYALVNTLAAAGERQVSWLGPGAVVGTTLLALLALAGTAWVGNKLPFVPADLTGRLPHLFDAFWNPEGFHPNIVGGLLAIWVPVTVTFLWYARSWPGRILLLLLSGGQILTLFLTQSRGAIFGLAVALLISLMAVNRRWAWLVPALVVAAGVGVAVWGPRPILSLMLGNAGGAAVTSAEGRLELFLRGWLIIRDFPLTGIGPGMFPLIVDMIYPLFTLDIWNPPPHVHNIYLQMGVDHGVPGLVAFLALVMLCVVMAVQSVRRSRQRPWEPLTVGLLAGLAAYLLHGLVDATGYTPRASVIIWAFLGLLVGVWRWVTSHSEDGRPE